MTRKQMLSSCSRALLFQLYGYLQEIRAEYRAAFSACDRRPVAGFQGKKCFSRGVTKH